MLSFREKIIDWNQRRNEKIDVSTLIKWKEKSKAQRGASGSIDKKLDGMIRALGYHPDMFGPTQTHHRDEEEEMTLEDEDEVDEQDF
ncbi:hypothetical protein Goshw_001986 [Gossypium schwendimanii]|uniref:Uncharacterized protein n=1 Tax=Gossypium schwendimanii TaxID=34291 RepID=A0A7J9LSR5_GOSSC|nr:hypothetical protein [Gossypium schwendimanii]